jgi:hypothetical protein
MNMYAFRRFDCVWSWYFMDGLACTCFENSTFSHISSTCVKVKTSSTHIRNVGECDVFKAHSNICAMFGLVVGGLSDDFKLNWS